VRVRGARAGLAHGCNDTIQLELGLGILQFYDSLMSLGFLKFGELNFFRERKQFTLVFHGSHQLLLLKNQTWFFFFFYFLQIQSTFHQLLHRPVTKISAASAASSGWAFTGLKINKCNKFSCNATGSGT
jgi:hypothetical protein